MCSAVGALITRMLHPSAWQSGGCAGWDADQAPLEKGVAASVHQSKHATLRLLARVHREQAGPHACGTIARMALKHVSHDLSSGRREVTSHVATQGQLNI